jgi:hypothetical protein
MVLVGRLERKRDRFQDLGVDGKKLKIIIKIGWESISRINVVKIRQVAGFCEKATEPLGSLKCREFLTS